MNTLVKRLKTATITLGVLLSAPLLGIGQASASGLLSAKGSGTELQIQDHVVNVTIEDGYAITSVENTFFNPSSKELEAIYEFPIPDNGTVAEFTVWIDGKAVIGEVVADLVSVLNPDSIIVGGMLAETGEHLLSGVREIVYQRCLSLATRNLNIAMAQHNPQAALHGAALLVRESAFSQANLSETVKRLLHPS